MVLVLVGVLVGGVDSVQIWDNQEGFEPLLQPLLLLFISSPLCVLATKRELRGFLEE